MTESTANKSGIRQIAEQAGVSIATVSRVLNGTVNVSAATRERVMSAVSQHQYLPNAAAKALATRRTRTVAAVIPTLEHSIFAVFMNALEDQLAASGYSLVIATHRFDAATELKRCNEVLRLGAEAIIVSGARHDPDLGTLLKSAGVPCLYTSVYDKHAEFASLGYDNRGLARRAIEYLTALGHRHIAVIHGPQSNNDRMGLRVAGVSDACDANPYLSVELHEAEIGAQSGAQIAANWFESGQLPDACLCLTDVFALGVLLEAQRQRVIIPQQMSVMGFEDVEWARDCAPRLTTIALPSVQMGVAAAMALVNHLDHGQPLLHQQFEAEIVERESTARLMS